MPKKPNTKKPGHVRKIIKRVHEPEKAEITIDGGEDLYREIRIENTLENEAGETVKLKEGAQVDVVVEADNSQTVPEEKKEHSSGEKSKR